MHHVLPWCTLSLSRISKLCIVKHNTGNFLSLPCVSSSLKHQAVESTTIYNHRWSTEHSQTLSLLTAGSRCLQEDLSCRLAKLITGLHIFESRQNEDKGSRGAALFPPDPVLLSHSSPAGLLSYTAVDNKATSHCYQAPRHKKQHPEEEFDRWPCTALEIISCSNPFPSSLL